MTVQSNSIACIFVNFTTSFYIFSFFSNIVIFSVESVSIAKKKKSVISFITTTAFLVFDVTVRHARFVLVVKCTWKNSLKIFGVLNVIVFNCRNPF